MRNLVATLLVVFMTEAVFSATTQSTKNTKIKYAAISTRESESRSRIVNKGYAVGVLIEDKLSADGAMVAYLHNTEFSVGTFEEGVNKTFKRTDILPTEGIGYIIRQAVLLLQKIKVQLRESRRVIKI